MDQIKTKIDGFTMRYAEPQDAALILQFIKELAEYEKLLDEVVATEELLHEWLFEQKKAEVLIGELMGRPIGYVLFFHNFSTFLGRGGIYLEDIYVQPAFRGRGFGKVMLQELAKIAVDRGCGRMEWACSDWNTPSIDFYLSLGAEAMSDWTIYRLSEDSLKQVSEG